MEVSLALWAVTIAGIIGLIVLDFVAVSSKPHEVMFKEALLWSLFYIGVAIAFGVAMWVWQGGDIGGQYFAAYLVEKSLSVDNLFVFLVILARFAVPALYRQWVLLIGVAIALVLRAAFILVGAAALSAFSWVFFIFGGFLLWTAVSVAREGGAEEGDVEYQENTVTRWVRKVFPATDGYRGAALWVRENGKRLVTPMLIVMVAIGTTDVLFALDSIPAIFGLTQDPYIVFTANAFALMGLRQLFFVVQGLLTRLIYLSYGLAVILGFIAVGLIFEALRANSLAFINGGEPVEWVPDIPTWVSLIVIVVVLVITTVASLFATRNKET